MNKRLEDYRLITAEVQYVVSEYPGLIQSFLWQGLDAFPYFPKLISFAEFWEVKHGVCLYKICVGLSQATEPDKWGCRYGPLTMH